MTATELIAAAASTILIKGSIVIAVALLLARATSRTAAQASFAFSAGFAALVVLPLLSPFTPDWTVGGLTISHGVTVRMPGTTFSLVALMAAVWLTGVLLMLVRLGLDVRAARRIASRASPCTDARTIDILRRAATSIGCRLPAARTTNELQTVALIGHRHPVLLVPAGAHEWSEEELFGVFCHELEHQRRGDWLLFMMERVVAAVYWPNPLTHFAMRAAHATRELAADDAALRGGAGALAYANRLILVARDQRGVPRLVGAVAFAGSGRVDGRVRALFEAERDRKGVTATSISGAVVLTLPVVLLLAALQPWGCLPA